MALGILMKGPSLNWTDDNQLYDQFKAWGKRVQMLTTGIALKKEPQEFICHCIKAQSGKTGQAHIKSVGLTGNDASNTICILGALGGHCKPSINDIVAATAYKQLVQGDLDLPECIEKCMEVTAKCNFEAAYERCLQNAILL